MSLEEIVELTIVVSTTTLTRPGFGTPLALVSSVPVGWGTGIVREFSKLSELTDLGFATTHPAYKLSQKITSQSPRVRRWKLAKRAVAPTQSLKLKCLTATPGAVYKASFGVGGGAVTEISYTVPSAGPPTTSTVATAIAALIAPITGVAAVATTDTITVTPESAGTLVNVKDFALKGSANFSLSDATADPGVEADLDNAIDADPDWYGVLLDSNSELEIKAAAAWTEANKKLFLASTCDTEVSDTLVTTDLGSDLKGLGYKRTVLIFGQSELLDYRAAAWMSRGFAFDAGSITWAFKDLPGIAVDNLKTGQRSALKAKNVNFYTSAGGQLVTRWGVVSSGEYIDVTHGIDWLDAEMRLQVAAAIFSLPKVPYTKSGLAVIEAAVKAVLKAGVRQKLLDAEGITVVMPVLEDIDPITRQQRLVPNIEFGARLAGAIHSTAIAGTLTN